MGEDSRRLRLISMLCVIISCLPLLRLLRLDRHDRLRVDRRGMHPAGRSGNINTDNNDAKWGHFKRPRWGMLNAAQFRHENDYSRCSSSA